MQKSKLQIFKSSSGQALVTLLFFVLIGLTIISAAAVMVFGNIQSASVTEQGNYAYFVAESGIQEALIRIIRDPGYSGTPVGQPLSIGEGNVVIQVSSSSGVITATATGTFNNNVRKIQLQTVYNNNVASISSWKEIQ